jgi:amino acid adenylation domain-containing protein
LKPVKGAAGVANNDSDVACDTIGARLAQIAQRFPDNVAIVEKENQVNYRQLDTAATAIARQLRDTGGDSPGRVCLFFQDKLPAIKGMFGAARAGHAYVPLDAGDPEERLRFIAGDCEPFALLTESSLLERARAIAPPNCVVSDVEQPQFASGTRTLPRVASDATLYLYYTSGSTGRPKGVMQTNRNVLFSVDTYTRALEIGAADRLSLLYTLSFGAAHLDIFSSLLNGAAICAYDMRRDGAAKLADWLDRERITVLHTVPTVYRELGNRLAPGRILPHVRVIDLGGESVFASDIDLFRGHFLEGCVLINQFAATEIGLIAQHKVEHGTPPSSTSIVAVGRCIDDVRVEIRRDDGSAAAAGEVGEMVVCSRYISPGYWRRPDLDAAAFSADPLQAGGRKYASGDFGHVDEAGDLHFLGRKGSRIKIRGHSVDLMEIEAALATCAGVTKAAAVAFGGESKAETVRLVAFVATRDESDRDPVMIRRDLATRLPLYMLPSRIVFLDALPLTSSGKIDRKALAGVDASSPDAARPVEPPRDEVEQAVAGVFEQLLKVTPIGRGDDFFMLGGDSLLGVELQTRLRETFGVHVANFHEDATVARIAANVRHEVGASTAEPRAMPVLIPLWQRGDAPPLFLIHGRHGQAFVSPHFMRLLGNDQPVWAFQARGLDGLHEPHPTVEDMAADYLAAMRKQRPHGPYFLGSLCAGAYIAAVMARALQDAGETVLPLLLLDPPESLLHQGYSTMTEEAFVRKMKRRRAQGGSVGPEDDPAYMQAVRRTAMAFEHAIAHHSPQPYDGSVYMLGSRQRGSDPAGLRKIFTGSLKRFEVGTTHAEALNPKNPVFANYLLRCVGLIRQAAEVA